ncbi:methyl-accepting chemotaxis protein [Alkalicella caledoniensis]|uniref:Methyl-accepting chemotaxis protein n=1 Tax=Alkalicella caledoniensis TaxID=2731377 RepID=A0A7G9WB41_ALKCA|nr:methyl-accepting chemotaxis protein [Alkalicella caledoniensis]QNO15903.1 methyl-accepting chemotaxis protein [Alkalicella caledoniensis]
MKTIKIQLIVVFTLIIVISIGSLSIISINRASSAILNEAEKALGNSVVEAGKYITSRVDNQLTYVETLSQNQIIFDDEMPWEEKANYFYEEAKRTGYTGFAFADIKGESRVFDHERTVLDISERDYFQGALTGTATTSDIIISLLGDGAIIIYAVPVKVNNEIIGVFYGWRDGLAISEILADISFGETGESYTLNKVGTVTGHADTTMVLNQFNFFNDLDDSYQELIEVKHKIVDGSVGIDRVMYGEQSILGYAPVEKTPWMVVLSVPEKELLSEIDELKRTLLVIVSITILIGIGITYFTSIFVVKPIKKAVDHANNIAKLDIRNDVPQTLLNRKDEMGTLSRALQSITDNLRTFVKHVDKTSEEVAKSSGELSLSINQSLQANTEVAKTIEEIAKGASEQAENTEKGAVNINDLTMLIEEERRSIDILNKSVYQVDTLKEEGLQILKGLNTDTERSNDSLSEISSKIVDTNKSVGRIEEASSMIKSIANQTNLLALNAAIEAARAGETGRGFAVVADEIRKLAEQSSDFAEEISVVIKELTEKTTSTVALMDTVTEIAKLQTQSVEQTDEKFSGIATSIENMNNLIEGVTEIAKGMEAKKEEIVNIIHNLSAISQQHAAGSEETSASVQQQNTSMSEIATATERLAQLAREMRDSFSGVKY